MRRKTKQPPVSDAVLDVAAHAYDLIAELENPARDQTMIVRARRHLALAVRALPVEERIMLAKRAGR